MSLGNGFSSILWKR